MSMVKNLNKNKLADYFYKSYEQYMSLSGFNNANNSDKAIDPDLEMPSIKTEHWKYSSVKSIKNYHFNYCKCLSVVNVNMDVDDEKKSHNGDKSKFLDFISIIKKNIKDHFNKNSVANHVDPASFQKMLDHVDMLANKSIIKNKQNVLFVIEDQVYLITSKEDNQSFFIESNYNLDKKHDKSIDSSNKKSQKISEIPSFNPLTKIFDKHSSDYEFYHLNQVFKNNHYRLYIKKDIKDLYIYNLYLDGYKDHCGFFAKLNIIIAKNTHSSIIHRHFFCNSSDGDSCKRFVNFSCDLTLQDNAHLNYQVLLNSSSQKNHQNNNLFISSTRIILNKNAYLQKFISAKSTDLMRFNCCVLLNAQGSNAVLSSANVCKYNLDLQTQMIHAAKNSQSHQFFKTVCIGKSKAVIDAKIHILKECADSDANLLIKNLLLDENSKVYTKPQLISDCDDVKASHGATVSMIKDSDLWYFRSRAIYPAKAKKILVLGFLNDLLLKYAKDMIICDPLWQNKIYMLENYDQEKNC